MMTPKQLEEALLATNEKILILTKQVGSCFELIGKIQDRESARLKEESEALLRRVKNL